MPVNLVTEDLRNTRSVDFTIENILEGRLEAPPVSNIHLIILVLYFGSFLSIIGINRY